MTDANAAKRDQLATDLYPKGQYPLGKPSVVPDVTVDEDPFPEETDDLMAEVLAKANLRSAYQRVLRNKGAPGVDGVRVEGLKAQLQTHWPQIKEALRAGTYQPQPVRAVSIAKPDGGTRTLGIPTVMDRLIQQAIHQVLSPLYDPNFSAHSYGYRPGRSAGQAVRQAREHIAAGYGWLVDLDLEKFFDRVNHDILMSRLARRIEDKRLLQLIRHYLEAGMMTGGLETARSKGMPQGGPLSPLLSNIQLDELDKELEARGHRFCRYADDCNIYVKSERAGKRVLDSVSRFLHRRLKLRINPTKSGVARPSQRAFLGYSVYGYGDRARLKVAPKAIKRLKGRLKALFRRGRGQHLLRFIEQLNPVLRGWLNYYRHIGVTGILRELDGWIRRHLRKILWRQWKRVYSRTRMLMRLGLGEVRAWTSATNGRGPWWNAGASHMNQAVPKRLFDRMKLVSLVDQYRRLTSTT
ncbi:group II intron reverse transcriptase/maturase [Microbulbifer halophilus]|uniref:group II intron reverse transcriptase/maturase n=2 Tax=Microbulbifer halophilus TaxID=453963 RepID=UPI0022436F0D|nr:group II intron reverse transcriptase/maturase [Microbulbifer halophilus]MCW8128709.1 group II intron reverse transcriptase/maturase [Microbulbifer halophilus]